MREHPAEGARLARALLPWLGEWGRAIVEHHERFDGSGYPAGLKGREISLAGRIVAVADAFEVMTAPRAYKKAMTRSVALAEIVRVAGSQFDPDVVRAFLHVSAPRLRWAMGPTSWLVGTPVLGAAPSLTGAGIAAQAAVGATTVAVAGMTTVMAPAAASPPKMPTPMAAIPHQISSHRAPGHVTGHDRYSGQKIRTSDHPSGDMSDVPSSTASAAKPASPEPTSTSSPPTASAPAQPNRPVTPGPSASGPPAPDSPQRVSAPATSRPARTSPTVPTPSAAGQAQPPSVPSPERPRGGAVGGPSQPTAAVKAKS